MNELTPIFQGATTSGVESALQSPPDVFAVCGTFIRITGKYIAYADSNPYRRDIRRKAVADAQGWRTILDKNPAPNVRRIPGRIRNAWDYVCKKIHLNIGFLAQDRDFVECCLYLIAACDEACSGVGVPSELEPTGSYFELHAEGRLQAKGTLCKNIDPVSVRVLPKQHTPKSGLNIRSITHNLALFDRFEVTPIWHTFPRFFGRTEGCNVLLAPWPIAIQSSDFKPSSAVSKTKGVGYFEYCPNGQANDLKEVERYVKNLFEHTHKIGQKPDIVVFPECSLSVSQWETVCVVAEKYGAVVLAGVHIKGKARRKGSNQLRIRAPQLWMRKDFIQNKHHRWKVDRSQVLNYSLGGTLSAEKCWWESIKVEHRELGFFAMHPDLVMCPLICEDLARQEPVADLVRSVGPNLVVALLMDGPQIDSRWSSRYATVLAEDPGSSVLTLSSLGMVKLSKPPRGCKPTRTIGSWKEGGGEFMPLELGERDAGLLLNLQFKYEDEISADGRSDGGISSTPVLCGLHQIPG